MKNLKKLSILGLVALALTGCGEKPNLLAGLSYGKIDDSKLIVEAICNGETPCWLVPVAFHPIEGRTFSEESYNFCCGYFTANGRSAVAIVETYCQLQDGRYSVADYGGYSSGKRNGEITYDVIFMFSFEVTQEDTFKYDGRKIGYGSDKVYVTPGTN